MRRSSLRHPARSRAFTLLEALTAVTILGVVVLAVTAAITASQKVAFEGQKRILAAMSADDLMSELLTLTYDDLRARDGTIQPVGSMVTLDGEQYPDVFWALGRTISVENVILHEASLDISVSGVLVRIVVTDGSATLAEAEVFVPEPIA